MKKWIIGSLLILLGTGAFITDRSFNFGFPIGYYGELNRLTTALKSLPGVSVERIGYNSDLTLEEITFWIKIADGLDLRINFWQSDPIRELWGQRLEDALATRLAEPCNRPLCYVM